MLDPARVYFGMGTVVNLPMAGVEQIRPALLAARSWAKDRQRSGAGDPPWQQYQMMKLIEAVNALLNEPREGLLGSDARQGTPRREGPVRRRDTSRFRVVEPVPQQPPR